MELPDIVKPNSKIIDITKKQIDAIREKEVLAETAGHQEKILEYYSELVQKVSKLDNSVNDILAQHEKDFLTAFRCHMNGVYNKLMDLKKRTDEEEVRWQREGKLKELHTSLEWLKDESERLNCSLQESRQEVDKWKTKAQILQNDYDYLESKYKIAQRNLNVLRMELTRKSVTPTPGPAFSQTAPLGNMTNTDILGFQPGNKWLTWLKGTFKLEQDLTEEISSYIQLAETKYKETVTHLQRSLEFEKKRIKGMLTSSSNAYESKNELEQLFIECIDEVRRDVIKRRSNYNQRYRNSIHGGEVLNGSDKQRVLEMLICNEQVLVVLYELLFPHKASAISEIAASWAKIGDTSSETTGRSTKLELDKVLDELTPSQTPQPTRQKPHRRSISMHQSYMSNSFAKTKVKQYRKDIIVHNGKLLLSKFKPSKQFLKLLIYQKAKFLLQLLGVQGT